ncbi:MAG TPA: protein kinase [Pirellulaceae bacterium]|nr:protein kinase [Pirellulaceae bacterium]
MATCGVCGVRVSGESEDGLCPRCRRAGLDGSGAGRAGTGTRVAGFERPVAPPASVEEEPFDRRDLRRTIMARARARRSLETQKPGFDGDTSTPSPLGTAPLALPPAGPDLADTAPFVPRDASGTGTAPLGLVTAADKTPDAPRAVDPLGTAPLGLTPDGRARDGGSPNVGRPAPSPFDTAPLGNGHGPAASPVGSAGDAKGTRRLGGMNDGPIVGTNGGSGVGPARTSESPNDSDLPTRLIVPLHDPRSDEADFVLQRKLGEGAMGIVWEALERLTGRRVALKRIKPEFAAELQSQFFYEARITATLEHPNIAPIYDLGFDQDRVPFYAQKKIVGRTWTELLDDLFDQPEPRRLIEPHLDHFERVLDAIGLAHDRGVLHRDIKPDNVMIGEFGEIYVTDWGLAIRPRDLPGVGDPRLSAGSPAYMSPEVAGGSEARVGFPSDVYLLGALLFELATGRAPHEPVADDLSPEQAMREAFRLARENRFGIEIDPTDELQAIAVRVMATRPEQRPSIGEIREDLKEYRGRVQSRRLSDTAAAEFERAIETGDLGRFQKSFYGFETALDLWSENPDAIVGLRRTRLEWARTLAAKHNYNQALAVLDTQVPEQRQLATLYARRASRQRFQRLTIVGLWAVLVLGSIGAIGAGAMALQQIASAKNELAGIEKQAVVSQEKAETETRKAEEATRLASEKQALAAAETERARIATEAATEATTALEKARDEIRTVNADLNAKQAELTRKETELQAKQTELEEKNEKLAQATRDVQAAQAQQEAADRAATAARQAERLARSAQRPLMRELATEGYRGLIEAALTDASIDAVESAMEMLGRAEAQLNSLDPVYRDDDSAGGIDALSPHWESRYLSRRLWPGATIDLSGPIVSTALGDDGTMLVAGDRRLTVWRPNGDSFQAIAEVEVPGGGEIGPMLIAPDSRVAWIGTAGGNGTGAFPTLARRPAQRPRARDRLVGRRRWSGPSLGPLDRHRRIAVVRRRKRAQKRPGSLSVSDRLRRKARTSAPLAARDVDRDGSVCALQSGAALAGRSPGDRSRNDEAESGRQDVGLSDRRRSGVGSVSRGSERTVRAGRTSTPRRPDRSPHRRRRLRTDVRRQACGRRKRDAEGASDRERSPSARDRHARRCSANRLRPTRCATVANPGSPAGTRLRDRRGRSRRSRLGDDRSLRSLDRSGGVVGRRCGSPGGGRVDRRSYRRSRERADRLSRGDGVGELAIDRPSTGERRTIAAGRSRIAGRKRSPGGGRGP